MKPKHNILKSFKSTILGLVFICAAFYLQLQQPEISVNIVSGLLVAGVMLLFTPDTLINFLEKKILGKVLFEEKPKEKG